MSKRYKIQPHYKPRIGSLNSRCSNSSLALCQRITNVQNKMSCQRKQLQEQNHTVFRMNNSNFLVDPATGSLEWQTNNNSTTRFSDRDRCIHNGLGVQLPISTSDNGGSMESYREKTSHKCFRLESEEKIHMHLKIDNVTVVNYVNKMGEQSHPF